jgi:hypothetical protein
MNLTTTTIRNLTNSETVQKAIQDADNIYKDLKGVSSGAPKFVNVAGKGMTVLSIYSDIDTLATEKSGVKREFALESLASNVAPPPYNVIIDIMTSIGQEVYDNASPETKELMEYARTVGLDPIGLKYRFK